MDETAKALARLREDAKAEKSAKANRETSNELKSPAQHGGTGSGNRKATPVAPASATTKRQKSG